MSGLMKNLVILSFGMLLSGLATPAIASVDRLPQIEAAPKQARNIKVLCFYTDWAAPCKNVRADLEKLSAENASVTIEAVNADDPNNQSVMKQYDICPVPTLVFLDENKKVISYSIGYPGTSTLNKEVTQLLNSAN